MAGKNQVYFKATKDNIIVMLDGESDFEEIKLALKTKVREARRFFGNSSTSIVFSGRDLDSAEESELISIISVETDLNISAISNVPVKKPPREIFDTENGASGIDEAVARLAASGESAVFHRGALRSGMSIEHEGSVIVLGDVNPGGEIIAGGNIIVLGTLKGMAHAGAFGNSGAFVAAISLQPMQLRISNIITSLGEEPGKRKKGISAPSYAYIQHDRIYIEPM